MDAIVTVKFRFDNVCCKDDLCSLSFRDMVKHLIKVEGICGVIDTENYEIVSVEAAPPTIEEKNGHNAHSLKAEIALIVSKIEAHSAYHQCAKLDEYVMKLRQVLTERL